MVAGILFLAVPVAVLVCFVCMVRSRSLSPIQRSRREPMTGRKGIKTAGFVLQSLVSILLLIPVMTFYAWLGPILSAAGEIAASSFAGILEMTLFLTFLLLALSFPLTFILALVITVKQAEIGFVSFLPSIQILLCVLLFLAFSAFAT